MQNSSRLSLDRTERERYEKLALGALSLPARDTGLLDLPYPIRVYFRDSQEYWVRKELDHGFSHLPGSARNKQIAETLEKLQRMQENPRRNEEKSGVKQHWYILLSENRLKSSVGND